MSSPAAAPPVILKGSFLGSLAKPRTVSTDDWPTPNPAEFCDADWVTGACDCRAWSYRAGCHKLSCRQCASDLRKRRMLAIRDRFEGPAGRGEKDVLYTIFTVPPELRAAAADPKTWKTWRRAIWKELRKKFGGLFAVERTDPCGDQDPDKWHPHLNFLWVQVGTARPYLDLEALKAEWARIIGADRNVVVYHQFSRYYPKLQHWYSYMGRTWPDWQRSVKSHLSVRWLGKYPKKVERPAACEKCGLEPVFVKDLDRAAAEELAKLGPAAVRAEWARRDADRRQKIRDSIGPPLPGGRISHE